MNASIVKPLRSVLAAVFFSGFAIAAAHAGQTQAAAGPLTLEQASQVALSAVPGGTFVYGQEDHDDGIRVYEVVVIDDANKHEFEINAATGAIVERKMEPIARIASGQPLADDPARESARLKALEASGGGVILEIKDETNRRGVRSIEFEIYNNGYKHDIEIDAATGAIIEHESELKK